MIALRVVVLFCPFFVRLLDPHIPAALLGCIDKKMIAALRKGKDLIRQSEDGKALIETKYRFTMDAENEEKEEEEEMELKPKKEMNIKGKKGKKHNNNNKREKKYKENKEKEADKKEKKTNNTFDRTLINTDMALDMDLSSLADEDLIGKLGELHGKLKTAEIRAKSRSIEKRMSDEQRDEEARIRQQQMEQIYRLMMADEQKFGIHDKGEMEEQLKLYSL
ncbi:unnamed protein product, partial [Mesorhabditis spiculigera]